MIPETSPQRCLYRRIDAVLRRDPRILSVECVGSVREGGEDEHSDVDLTVRVAREGFASLYRRAVLASLLLPEGALGLFMYFAPPHWGHLCRALFENGLFVDLVFRVPGGALNESERPVAPTGKAALGGEIVQRFWLDALSFLGNLDRGGPWIWESIRGLNLLRERHFLELLALYSERENEFPAFKNLDGYRAADGLRERLRDTLAPSTEPTAVRRAFGHMVSLFADLQKRGPAVAPERLQSVIERVRDAVVVR